MIKNETSEEEPITNNEIILDETISHVQDQSQEQSQDSKLHKFEHGQEITREDEFVSKVVKDSIQLPEEANVQDLEHANEVIDDVPNVEGATGIAGTSTEISKYIDSLELEVRCLKVSQQFFESTKEEVHNLKRQVQDLKHSLANEEHENIEMRKELKNLKESTEESQKCKICMEGKLEIVFTPCGHLFCCINCAPSCKNCPLCRKPANHLKIYLP